MEMPEKLKSLLENLRFEDAHDVWEYLDENEDAISEMKDVIKESHIDG